MKAAGIGAAFIGNINPEEKDGKVPMLSEDWWDHMCMLSTKANVLVWISVRLIVPGGACQVDRG